MKFNPLFDIEDKIKNKDYSSVYKALMLINDFHVIFNKDLVTEEMASQMFRSFSKEKFDLDVQDRFGKTFLMYACDKDYVGIIRYLCTHNADMNLLDNDGNTAFDIVNNKPLTVRKLKIKDALCEYYNPKTKSQRVDIKSVFLKGECKNTTIGRVPIFFYDYYETSRSGYANEFSRLIWAYKDKKDEAIEAVTEIFIKIFNTDFTVTCVPSSTVGNMNALPQVIRRLPTEYHIIDATTCLQRVKSIQSAHKGGNRSYSLHKDTIQLSDKSLIEGKNILLFDDIVTTGGSMLACCDILREANPKSIFCFCLGRTVFRQTN